LRNSVYLWLIQVGSRLEKLALDIHQTQIVAGSLKFLQPLEHHEDSADQSMRVYAAGRVCTRIVWKVTGAAVRAWLYDLRKRDTARCSTGLAHTAPRISIYTTFIKRDGAGKYIVASDVRIPPSTKTLVKRSRCAGSSKASGRTHRMTLGMDYGSMKNRSSLNPNWRRTQRRRLPFILFLLVCRKSRCSRIRGDQRRIARSCRLQSDEPHGSMNAKPPVRAVSSSIKYRRSANVSKTNPVWSATVQYSRNDHGNSGRGSFQEIYIL